MKRISWWRPSAPLAALALVLTPHAAHALVVGGAVTGGTSGGAFALVSPPATLGPDSLQSPDLVAFDELQGVVLSAPLPIGPGLVLGVGSVVSSHIVAFDPAQGATLEGTVLFDEPILGIVVGPPFGATNALFGLPSVTYVGAMGLGPEMPDFFAVAMGDPARLVLRIGANSPGDHFRVLTGTAVPEPTALATALPLAIAGALRRRTAHGGCVAANNRMKGEPSASAAGVQRQLPRRTSAARRKQRTPGRATLRGASIKRGSTECRPPDGDQQPEPNSPHSAATLRCHTPPAYAWRLAKTKNARVVSIATHLAL